MAKRRGHDSEEPETRRAAAVVVTRADNNNQAALPPSCCLLVKTEENCWVWIAAGDIVDTAIVRNDLGREVEVSVELGGYPATVSPETEFVNGLAVKAG